VRTCNTLATSHHIHNFPYQTFAYLNLTPTTAANPSSLKAKGKSLIWYTPLYVTVYLPKVKRRPSLTPIQPILSGYHSASPLPVSRDADDHNKHIRNLPSCTSTLRNYKINHTSPLQSIDTPTYSTHRHTTIYATPSSFANTVALHFTYTNLHSCSATYTHAPQSLPTNRNPYYTEDILSPPCIRCPSS
jgi:hypothetical protein